VLDIVILIVITLANVSSAIAMNFSIKEGMGHNYPHARVIVVVWMVQLGVFVIQFFIYRRSKHIFIALLWITNVFLEFISVMIAADISLEYHGGESTLKTMVSSCIISFMAGVFVTYKEYASNQGKLNISCLLLTFSPFILINGIVLGIYIGNNASPIGSGVPNSALDNMILLKHLPTVENNGVTSSGYVEEELWNDYDADGNIELTEVWAYTYRETGGDTWEDGTIV